MRLGGFEVDARALEVREPDTAKRSRITSFLNHRAVCKEVKNTVKIVETEVAGEDGKVVKVTNTEMTVEIVGGCLGGKRCEKGNRLAMQIDFPPGQVNNPPGSKAEKHARALARSSS